MPSPAFFTSDITLIMPFIYAIPSGGHWDKKKLVHVPLTMGGVKGLKRVIYEPRYIINQRFNHELLCLEM